MRLSPRDPRALSNRYGTRPPDRSAIEVRLTGSMERYVRPSNGDVFRDAQHAR